jgi:carbonic anhydrase/acetyltransferase-like protein (isoleucine patch superfamily)
MRIRYLEFRPDLGAPSDLAPMSAVAGRTTAGAGLLARPFATLRADGAPITVGRNAYFGERSTVHIAHETLPAILGDDVTVGRFGLVHACTLGHGVVVADGATVMDGAAVGAHALVGPGALVPPRRPSAPACPTRSRRMTTCRRSTWRPSFRKGRSKGCCTRCTGARRAWRARSSPRPPWSSAT